MQRKHKRKATDAAGDARDENFEDFGRSEAGSSSDGMHPRNPYRNNPPDFTLLAQKYPEFAKV